MMTDYRLDSQYCLNVTTIIYRGEMHLNQTDSSLTKEVGAASPKTI